MAVFTLLHLSFGLPHSIVTFESAAAAERAFKELVSSISVDPELNNEEIADALTEGTFSQDADTVFVLHGEFVNDID